MSYSRVVFTECRYSNRLLKPVEDVSAEEIKKGANGARITVVMAKHLCGVAADRMLQQCVESWSLSGEVLTADRT